MIVFLLSKKELVGKGLGMWIQGWRFSCSQRTGLDPEPVVSKRDQRTSQRPYPGPPVLSRLFHEICGFFENFPNPEIWRVLEISVKSGKDRVSTPQFGHTQGEIKKKPAKKYILAFKGV
jgi:hypothetical protein